MAGLNEESVVEAHGLSYSFLCAARSLMLSTGSFAEAECLECKQQYTKEEIKPRIELGQVVYCDEKGCEGNKAALVRLLLYLIRRLTDDTTVGR